MLRNAVIKQNPITICNLRSCRKFEFKAKLLGRQRQVDWQTAYWSESDTHSERTSADGKLISSRSGVVNYTSSSLWRYIIIIMTMTPMCGLIDETRLQLQGNSPYTLITPPWLKGRCVVWEKKIQTHNLDNCNINEVIKQMQKKKINKLICGGRVRQIWTYSFSLCRIFLFWLECLP